MIVHIQTITDDLIFGRIRAEGDGVVGDSTFEMSPGESFRGVTFDDLKAHGVGPFEFPKAVAKAAESESENPPAT